MKKKYKYKTLITIVKGTLDIEIIDFLEAKELRYNVFITEKSLIKTRAYIHGNWGIPMYDVIVTNLDMISRDVINNI